MIFFTIVLHFSLLANSLYNCQINSIDGEPIDLHQYEGKKILFVNVASNCGYTPQYKDLQKLQNQHIDDLTIIGLPCNQFLKQENASAEEIKSSFNS